MLKQLNRKSFRNLSGAILTVLALAIVSQAQEAASQNFSAVKIKNFGQMDERFYRGAQPKEKDYKDLAALGIKTVIDLTEDPKPYERSASRGPRNDLRQHSDDCERNIRPKKRPGRF